MVWYGIVWGIVRVGSCRVVVWVCMMFMAGMVWYDLVQTGGLGVCRYVCNLGR
jgi:hypothetical protein